LHFANPNEPEPGSGEAVVRKIYGGGLSPRRPPPEISAYLARADRRLIGGSTAPGPASAATAGPGSPQPLLDDRPLPWETDGGGEPSEHKLNPSRTVAFSKLYRSSNTRLSPDQASATTRGQDFGGFLVCDQKMIRKGLLGRWFELRIEEVDARKWTDGLGVGFLRHHPSANSVWVNTEDKNHGEAHGHFEGLACEIFADGWLIGYDGRIRKHGIWRYLKEDELIGGPWRPSQLQAGDTLALLVTSEGELALFVNNEVRYWVKDAQVPFRSDIFPVLDLDGSTTSVHIVDSNGSPNEKALADLGRVRDEQAAEKERARLPKMSSRRGTPAVGQDESASPSKTENQLEHDILKSALGQDASEILSAKPETSEILTPRTWQEQPSVELETSEHLAPRPGDLPGQPSAEASTPRSGQSQPLVPRSTTVVTQLGGAC